MSFKIEKTTDKEHGDYVVVDAQPGYFALDWYGEGLNDQPRIEQFPVVAWLVEVDDWSDKHSANVFLHPICTHELSKLHNGEILHPDGKVVIRGVQWWSSLADYIKETNEERQNKNMQTLGFDVDVSRFEATAKKEALNAANF